MARNPFAKVKRIDASAVEQSLNSAVTERRPRARWVWMFYSSVAYLAGLLVSLYSVAFFGNLGLAQSVDSPPRSNVAFAMLFNVIWLLLFGLQHSLMARPAFKKWLSRFVPPSAERSTYVLLSSAVMVLLFVAWQPVGGEVWNARWGVWTRFLWVFYFAGWAVMLWAIWTMNHWEMLGMRQARLCFTGRPYAPLPLKLPGLYRWVRHPMYLGWLIVFWATPIMTVGHLCLSIGLSCYILLAVRWEERDLLALYGTAYEGYRQKVPSLVPGLNLLTTNRRK